MRLPGSRRVRALAVAVALGGGLASIAAPAGAAPPESAGRFIVTLHDGADPRGVAAEYRRNGGADVDFVYTAALRGFAGEFSQGALGRLQADGRVARLERDGVASASAVGSWGLDRIDQRDLPLNQTYSAPATGAGVTAYVIDTGIQPHADFGARLVPGTDSVSGGNGQGDCNGHGTHVAGTIGGTAYGVAKSVTLVPVRVLDCGGSGYWSWIIAGVDWVTRQAARPAVANMSLGGGASASVDDAVRESIASGVTYAVAAGNSNQDACRYSPARTAEALTVGATTSSDARASYSNYGRCLDLFAPGSSITSAWIGSTSATRTISGTSMASPHVAGAAALHLSANPGASPSSVASALVGQASSGRVGSPGRYSPNLLLYVGAEADAPPSGGGGGGGGGKPPRGKSK